MYDSSNKVGSMIKLKHARGDSAILTHEETDRQDFGWTIASLRSYAGLSRGKLAKKAGLPVVTVARLEKGLDTPSESTKAKLEQALGCPLYFGNHEQILVEAGGRDAEVDVGIAPLIQELWIAGITTFRSCQQDVRGRMWIAFDDDREAAAFLDLVAQYRDGSDDLYWRMCGVGRGIGPLPSWNYSVSVIDLALRAPVINGRREESYEPPVSFRLLIYIHFPPQDLSVVLQRLRDHNSVERPSQDEAVSDEDVS